MNIHNSPQRAADAVSARSYVDSPLASLRSLRALAAAEIERLIALVDAIDDDPDFEPDGTDEPALAWTDEEARTGVHGASDDREIEDEHDEDTHDREAVNEDGGDVLDEPHDDGQTTGEDCEPSLGSLNSTATGDNTAWGGSDTSDAEKCADAYEVGEALGPLAGREAMQAARSEAKAMLRKPERAAGRMLRPEERYFVEYGGRMIPVVAVV